MIAWMGAWAITRFVWSEGEVTTEVSRDGFDKVPWELFFSSILMRATI